jgi:hypothetical protein
MLTVKARMLVVRGLIYLTEVQAESAQCVLSGPDVCDHSRQLALAFLNFLEKT